jgi:hypothetical protein
MSLPDEQIPFGEGEPIAVRFGNSRMKALMHLLIFMIKYSMPGIFQLPFRCLRKMVYRY